MCDIYDRYLGPEETDHNCLGCTLDSCTEDISKFLEVAAKFDTFSEEQSFALLSHLLNSLWERMTDVFDILCVPDSYRCRHYQPFIQIRRWANFFKHPKEFGWLVHHPIYCHDGTEASEFYKSSKDHKIVQDEFLKKYYTANRTKGMAKELSEFQTKVVVILPDVPALIRGVSVSLLNFRDVVTQNPVYVEILQDKATIKNYYETEQSATTVTPTTTRTTQNPQDCEKSC